MELRRPLALSKIGTGETMSVRVGFVIGFLLAAILGGAWAWREGLLRPAEERRAQALGETPGAPPPAGTSAPPAGGSPAAPPAGEAAPQTPPAAAPTPQPTQPAVSPTPQPTPPTASPPGVAPSSPTPPPAAGAAPVQPGTAAFLSKDGKGADDKGAFDVVRVEPSGEAVVAGRCAADCTAELTANGKVIDTAKADASGSFAMVPPALPPGDHQLGLKITTPEGAQATSEQTVTVSVPKAPSKEVVVVLNEPDAPSKVLQRPGQAPASAPPAAGERQAATPNAAAPAVESVAGLSLGAIDAEKGRFFVQGTAPAGSKLRIYLNNTLMAEATAGADGRWSLRVERGLTPGRYTARVDHVGPDGKVLRRAEAGFDYEAEVAAAPPAPTAQAEPQSQGTQPTQSGAVAPGAAENPAASSADSGGEAARRADGTGASSADGGPRSLAGSGTAGPSGAGPATSGAPSTPSTSAGSQAPATPSTPNAPQAPADQPAAGTQASGGSAPGGQAASAAASSGAGSEASVGRPSADPANPVVAQIDTAQVRRGDSLWRISRATYGQGRRYTVIFSANDDQIRDPNLIYPGQVLVLPTGGAEASETGKR